MIETSALVLALALATGQASPPPPPPPAPRPARPGRLAVVDFVTSGGANPALGRALAELAAAEAGRVGAGIVITQGEIANMLGLERTRQLLSCSDQAACLVEIAGALRHAGDLRAAVQRDLAALSPPHGRAFTRRPPSGNLLGVSLYVVDVESDGPIPGKYSMVSFGAVVVEPGLGRTFYGTTRPISELWLPEALAISGITRAQHLAHDEPGEVMAAFERWVNETSRGKPVFFSDNLAFDWQFVNWYFHTYLGRNPFGWSGRRIGDLYCGMVKDAYAQWKHLRRTDHDHHPVNDAKGNAEALLALVEMGLKLQVR